MSRVGFVFSVKLPCKSILVGKPSPELVKLYLKNKTKTLSKYNEVNNNVYISNIEGLTLQEYRNIRKYLCQINHTSKGNCDCNSIIEAAELILSNGHYR